MANGGIGVSVIRGYSVSNKGEGKKAGWESVNTRFIRQTEILMGIRKGRANRQAEKRTGSLNEKTRGKVKGTTDLRGLGG